MKLRATIPVAAAALALAAPAAHANLEAHSTASASATSHLSAAALNALNARWQALGEHYQALANASAVRPDDRSGIRGVGSGTVAVIAKPQATPFSWGDAALGAGAMLLLLTALVGSVRLSNLTRNAQRSLRTS